MAALYNHQKRVANEAIQQSRDLFCASLSRELPVGTTVTVAVMVRETGDHVIRPTWMHSIRIDLRTMAASATWNSVLRRKLGHHASLVDTPKIYLFDYEDYLRRNMVFDTLQQDQWLNHPEAPWPFAHGTDHRRFTDFIDNPAYQRMKLSHPRSWKRKVRGTFAIHPGWFVNPHRFVVLVDSGSNAGANRIRAHRPRLIAHPRGHANDARAAEGAEVPPGGNVNNVAAGAAAASGGLGYPAGSLRLPVSGVVFSTELTSEQGRMMRELDAQLQHAGGASTGMQLQGGRQLQHDQMQLMKASDYFANEDCANLLRVQDLGVEQRRGAAGALFRWRQLPEEDGEWVFQGSLVLLSNRYILLCLHELYHTSKQYKAELPDGTPGRVLTANVLQPLQQTTNPRSRFAARIAHPSADEYELIPFGLEQIVYPEVRMTTPQM